MSEILSKLISYRIRTISRELRKNYNTSSFRSNESPVLSYSNYQSTKVPPRDPPLIILHGLFGSKSNWTSLGKAFASSGRRVITVDARNHGDSSHVDRMDYLSMADDVEKFMYKLDIHKAIILGHSMGGKTAMCLAVNRPHLVEKLIIEDVSPDVSRTSAVTSFPQYLDAMRNVHFDEQVKTLAQARKVAGLQIEDVFQDPAITAFILTNLRKGPNGFEWRINIDAIQNSLEDLVGFPVLSGIYAGETLFIGGANSQHIQPQDEPRIKKLFPNATIDWISGAGHWVHADKPYEFLQRVQQFIDDLNK